MRFKKFYIGFSLIFILFIIKCLNTSALSNPSKSDILIKAPSLKISLFQTAYEVYNVNISNPTYYDEKLYSNSHYKWIKSVYNDLDDSMKIRLKNIFSYNTDSTYIDTLVGLDDNCSLDDIVDCLLSNDDLNISNSLKNDLDIFLNYFYDNSFKSYFEYHKLLLTKDAKALNKKLQDNNVSISNFVSSTSGISINNKYNFIIYLSLNPIEYNYFEYNNNLISTLSPNTSLADIVSLNFYRYSKVLFSTFKEDAYFIYACEMLKHNKEFIELYNNKYINYYTFSDWCLENLVSGFSKYLDYMYFGSSYENNHYVYDLEFYNYLKDESFNPENTSLLEISTTFLNSITK